MCLQTYDLLNDNEGIGLPAVHTMSTSSDTKLDKRLITAQEFIHAHVETLYYRQTSSVVEQPESTLNCDKNGFLVCTETIDEAVRKVVPRSPQPGLVYVLHYPTSVGNLGEWSI